MVGLPWRGRFPLADGMVSKADRRHIAGHYSGIAAAIPAGGTLVLVTQVAGKQLTCEVKGSQLEVEILGR